MTTEPTKLCPFCGGIPRIGSQPNRPHPYKYWVDCNKENCPAKPRVAGTSEADAIDRWNIRVAPDPATTKSKEKTDAD